MPEGSDSGYRDSGDRPRPAPFDQDADDFFAAELPDDDAPDRNIRAESRERPGQRAEEPDFEGFLAATREEQESAGTAYAEANLRAFTALADADREAERAEPVVEARPPTVVVVATRGGPTLERCVSALAAQDLTGITVLALDGSEAAAEGEPLSARVAAVAPRALVRRVDAPPGDHGPAVPALANDVIEAVQGATFFVFVADNVVLDASAIRALVDEAVVSNAGIAAPKLVSDDAPDELVDVGWLVDRYGDAWSIAEPGERDQEQHDAVRDVFFVSARTMLVRCDLFAELGGFDQASGPAAARDLAWRARVAGARVIVVPEARGRVVPDATPVTPSDIRALTRGRLRTVYKTGSRWTVLWTLPLAVIFIVLDALVQLLRGRRPYSGAVLAGGIDGLRDVPELHRERKSVQSKRMVPDGDLHPYMVRGSARLRRLVTRRFHVDDRIAGASLRTQAFLGDGERSWRRHEGLLFGVLVLVALVATRSFITGGTPSFAQLMSWPRASTLFHDFAAGHRSTFYGSDLSAPPLLAVCGAIVGVFVGHADLARTALVVLSIPLGMGGLYWALRRTSVRAWPAIAAAAAYGANPVSRNAIARGELGVIALFVLAPLLWAVATGRPAPDVVDADEPPARLARSREQRIGHVARLTLLTAFAVAWWPPAILLPLLFAGVEAASVGLTGVRRFGDRAVDVAVDAACATVAAFVLVLPWSVAFLSGDGVRIGIQARPAVTVQELFAVNSGPNGAGWLGLGLTAAAVLPLLVATGERLQRAVAAWLLVVFAVLVPLVAQHLSARAPLPEIDGLLVVSALALAVAIGLGVASFQSELRSFIFGARQLVAVACLVVLVLPMVAWLGDVADGRVHAPGTEWNDRLSWMRAEAEREGGFRVLWLGPGSTLPSAAIRSHGVDLSVTDDGVGDVRSVLPATSEPVRLSGESVALAHADQTERLGRLLAPMGVRYIAVVNRAAPDAPSEPTDGRTVRALDRQLDLELYDTERGMRLYRNDAWVPRLAVVPPGTTVPIGPQAARDPIGAALSTDLSGARKITQPAGPGTLYLSDNAAAEATLNGAPLPSARAYGWAHAWPLTQRGTVAVSPPSSWWAGAWLTLAILAWIVVGVFAFRPSAFGYRRVTDATLATAGGGDR